MVGFGLGLGLGLGLAVEPFPYGNREAPGVVLGLRFAMLSQSQKVKVTHYRGVCELAAKGPAEHALQLEVDVVVPDTARQVVVGTPAAGVAGERVQ